MPEAQIDARVAMYTPEDEDALLSGQPDYVLDAIDNIDTKVALLAACRRRGLPVVCVAAAGAGLPAALAAALREHTGVLRVPARAPAIHRSMRACHRVQMHMQGLRFTDST